MNELAFAFAILILLITFIIIFKIIRTFLLSRKHENNYKIAMITLINENKEENEEYFDNINDIYTVYINNKYQHALDVFTLNAKLILELRNQRYSKYYNSTLPNNGKIANEIEEINKHMLQRLRNDDEKLIKVFEKIDALPVDDKIKISMETFKGEMLSYIESIVSTCAGRIMEKDIAFSNISLKLKKSKRMKTLTYIVGAIGIVSGLITILKNTILK